MYIKTFCKRFMLWTAIITAVVMLICGLCFGKFIEETLFLEIAKWVVMTIVIIGIMETFAYTLSQFFYHGSKWDPTSAKYKELREKAKDVDYKVYDSNIKIINSYLASKVLFEEILYTILEYAPEHEIWRARTLASLRREWAAHNLAYALHIARERTKDSDLNLGQKWYEKLAYFIVGSIALVVIK